MLAKEIFTTAFDDDPASELLGSTNKTITIISDDIRNQLLSSKLIFLKLDHCVELTTLLEF